MFMFYVVTDMVLKPAITKRFSGKLVSTCRVLNGKTGFLVLPLGLAQILHDGCIFLIVGIVKCNSDVGNFEGTMLEEHLY